MTRRIQPITRTIEAHTRSYLPWKKLTDQEREFVHHEIARGLTDIEVTRMFFRRFGRDLTAHAVKMQRSN